VKHLDLSGSDLLAAVMEIKVLLLLLCYSYLHT
jgi:hypothetical protein